MTLAVCKYWARGSCNRGQFCKFMHTVEKSHGVRQTAPSMPNRNFAWMSTKNKISEKGKDLEGRVIAMNGTGRPELVRVKQEQVSLKVITGKGKDHSEQSVPEQARGEKDEKKTEQPGPPLKDEKDVLGLQHLFTLLDHQKSITGITQLSCNGLIFTGSADQDVKAWGNKGKLSDSLKVTSNVKSMVSGCGWALAAIGGEVHAWNTKNGRYIVLSVTSTEIINVLAIGEQFFVAGTDRGKVYGWGFLRNNEGFSAPALIMNSDAANTIRISALKVAGSFVFSGFEDGTIKVFEQTQWKLLFSVSAHTSKVTSLLLFSNALISSSLDGTIKCWSAEKMEALYTHTCSESGGVAGAFTTTDAQGRPVLGCFYDKSSDMRVYDLPTFSERGVLSSKVEITSVVSTPESGVILVGDKQGAVKVYQWM